LWWAKNTPVPVPLVTTGDPSVGFDPNGINTVNTAGALGQPGTRVLLGGRNINAEPYSGLRLTLGGWLEDEEVLGVEGSAFALESQTNRFTAASDQTGSPPLYFPIFSPLAGAERAVPIADPLRQFSGTVGADATLHLWGVESHGIISVLHTPNVQLTLLAGFRYASLTEGLRVDNTTTDLIFGTVTSLRDSFDTTNQFYGGQLGSRLILWRDLCSLEVTSKVALGSTYQVVDVFGVISQSGPRVPVPPGPGPFPGGLFAQPSNIGLHSANRFSVLPSLDVTVGYDITPRARVFAGYDILYWTGVVRPGNQIDHAVNLSQNAVLDPNGVGKLVGPARPAPLSDRSDFWAQGLHAGVEIRF
jgi:hypothetical protein